MKNEYWKINPKRLGIFRKKHIAKLLALETNVRRLDYIASEAPNKEICNMAEERFAKLLALETRFSEIDYLALHALHRETRDMAKERRDALLPDIIENGNNPDELRLAIRTVTDRNGRFPELMEAAVTRYPVISRKFIFEQVDIICNSTVIQHMDYLVRVAKLCPSIISVFSLLLKRAVHFDKAARHSDDPHTYSDCGHVDWTGEHTDHANTDRLAPLKPYIPELFE